MMKTTETTTTNTWIQMFWLFVYLTWMQVCLFNEKAPHHHAHTISIQRYRFYWIHNKFKCDINCQCRFIRVLFLFLSLSQSKSSQAVWSSHLIFQRYDFHTAIVKSRFMPKSLCLTDFKGHFHKFKFKRNIKWCP